MRKSVVLLCLLCTLFANAQEEREILVETEIEKPRADLTIEGEPCKIEQNRTEDDLLIVYRLSDYYNRRYALVEGSTKKKITPFVYEAVWNGAGKGLLIARLNKKYGVINTSGQEVIPFGYDEMKLSTSDIDGVACYYVKKSGLYGFVNEKNEPIVPLEYEMIDRNFNSQFWGVKKNGKVGLMKSSTRVMVIPYQNESITRLPGSLVLVKKDKLYSLYNYSGKMLLSNWYSNLDYYGSYDCALVELNGKKGLISETDKMIIPLEYDVLAKRPEKYNYGGLYLIAGKKGKYGVFGGDGKFTIPLQYDSINCVTEKFVIAVKNKKKNLLQVDGSTEMPVDYDEITWLSRYFLVKKDNKYGIIDRDGNLTVPLDYENLTIIRPARGAIALFVFASRKGKKGIVSMENGEIILPFEYDEIRYVKDQLAIVRKGSKFGVIDFYEGIKVVLPFEYKSIKYQNKLLTAEKNGLEKYTIDRNGNLLKMDK